MKNKDYMVLALGLVIAVLLGVVGFVKDLSVRVDEIELSIQNKTPIVLKEVEYVYVEPTVDEEVEYIGEGDLIKTDFPEFDFDFELVASVVASESMGESYNGQVAVAQCIYNTAQATGMSPAEVVSEPKQYADPMPYSEVSESVINACLDVFLNGNFVTDEPIRYFYAPKYMPNGTSKWHEENLEYVMTIGNHKFFK